MPRKRNNSDGSRLFNLEVCAFCGSDEDNELLYGKFIVSKDIRLHNNCMFFASGLSQKGENETDGFSGFLLEDIEIELRRGKKLFCSYCRKRGATVGCCEVKCKKSFHFQCGIEHGSLHQYFGSFSSFCKSHAPKQKTVELPKNMICHICCEDITLDNVDSCLYSPCCKNSWFHKICLQKYALSAGIYFFKCPLCNNSKEFIKEMEIHGICIPDKDASWELEDNAFQDLLTKPECDAPTCLCSKGRKYCPKKKSGWTLLPCTYCGYHARHKNCENIKSSTNSWVCSECKALVEEILESKVSTQVPVNVKDESDVKDSSTGRDDSKILTSSINCLPSSSSTAHSPSPVVIKFNTEKPNPAVQDIIQAAIDPFHSLVAKNTVTCNKVDDVDSAYSESESRKPQKATESRMEMPVCKIELNCISIIKSENGMQDKQVVSFKDIKNLSHSSESVRKTGYNKTQALRKVVKKRKLDTSCNNPKHYCIRKYFGQECGKFRI